MKEGIVMDSFISWFGGKKALREKIIKEFPEKEAYSRYVEVFGGAGWILFSSEKHAKKEIYNDIDGNLVNLFRCVKYHPEEIQKELELVLVSREQFYDAKEQIKIQGLTDIQRAARFYMLIKESFGSDHNSFGLVPRDMNKAREYLAVVSKRLSTVVIENADFEKVISSNDKKDTLFYLDPPYYGAENYYLAKFTQEDHLRLRGILQGIQGRFILSYNDCEFIQEQYRRYNIIKVDRAHNLKTKEKARYHEVIIKNFA